MDRLTKRTLLSNKFLFKVNTIFRTISGIELPKYEKHNKKSFNSNKYYKIIGVTTISCLGLYKYFDEHVKCAECKIKDFTPETNSDDSSKTGIDAGSNRPDLPTYSINDVKEHNAKAKEIWVVYKEGVYNVTKFVKLHPGGDIILEAAGSSLEPFWAIYGIHNSDFVYEMLESLRIGNLRKEDAENVSKNVKDPYFTDPTRHPILKPANNKPYNAEPYPSSFLVDKFFTPNHLFYVRNHLPVPVIDEKKHKLEIEIEGRNKKISFTMDELKTKFLERTVIATIMCAGNRRSEMSEVKPVKGLFWGNAAIGNASWKGVYLRDILISMGITDESNYQHVQFEGVDVDPAVKNQFYGASIPFNFAMDKNGEVLIAWEMNGEPLSRDHGFPLRVIVPGICGARNVKWLKKVVVSQNESQAFWQQKDYKSFSPSTDFDTADYAKAEAVMKLPVTSGICVPQPDETVKLENGYITVKGYAYSGGGNKIYRVDVTADEGNTWYEAKLESTNKKPQNDFSWTLWTVKIPVKSGRKEVEIWAKAMDSNHNTQPETPQHIWNIRGILSNAYPRVKVTVQ